MAVCCIGDGVRAYIALQYLGRVSFGDTVLIMDAATSFGSLVVQLAHAWGAKVSVNRLCTLIFCTFSGCGYFQVVRENKFMPCTAYQCCPPSSYWHLVITDIVHLTNCFCCCYVYFTVTLVVFVAWQIELFAAYLFAVSNMYF